MSKPRHALTPGETIPRHIHDEAYAAVVLDGGYEEAGERGRWRVRAGDVLIHGRFSGHWNRAPGKALVLNLPLPVALRPDTAMARTVDPDLLARLAQRDPVEAAAALLETLRPGQGGLADAPDLLALALSGDDAPGVETWARDQGVTRETAFRWFREAYGVGPARFRVEARARRAWRLIVEGDAPLVDIAAEAGFADQAHMSRDVKALTGRSPGAWRVGLQHSFKTWAA
ncbi:DNA-binding domain-containing protein, AraC-type [Caulobacter sp. AP07]|uniref:helix-turn-helix domain-containing protein n=1 Tax=Caulobacter sp. AP07 TaxID=1144304 RepID=UPI000271EE1D|nr:AraC family transcriptional regulator [Caulobacter sp. AP07]EJL26014.1 DNA-binding domain-containing protein, AraC-type [Caulobacter sp. AP07]